MTSTALVLSYFYEFLFLLAHAYQLYRLRQRRQQEAYEFLQETLTDLAVVQQTYKELKRAESQVINSELSLGLTQRTHLDSLRGAIARIRQRVRDNTPDLAAA